MADLGRRELRGLASSLRTEGDHFLANHLCGGGVICQPVGMCGGGSSSCHLLALKMDGVG